MIKQLANGTCVNVETIDDLEGVLSSEQLELVKLLIDVKDEYIEKLEEQIEDLETDMYLLEEEIELLKEEL